MLKRECNTCHREFESEDQFKACDSCREKGRKRAHRHAEKHHIKGFCNLCHKPYESEQYKMCEPCRKRNREYTIGWAQAHPGRISENNNKKHRANRLIVLQHYSNSNTPFCSCCGESLIEFLCLDHINGGGREHRKNIGWGGRYYDWLIREGFPSGLRVLCHNCNQSYGAYDYCPHQKKEVE